MFSGFSSSINVLNFVCVFCIVVVSSNRVRFNHHILLFGLFLFEHPHVVTITNFPYFCDHSCLHISFFHDFVYVYN